MEVLKLEMRAPVSAERNYSSVNNPFREITEVGH